MTTSDPSQSPVFATEDSVEYFKVQVADPRAVFSLGKWKDPSSNIFVGLRASVAHRPAGVPLLGKWRGWGGADLGAIVESELVLGEDHSRGFVGLLGNVPSGQVFFSAGGGVFGVADHAAAAKAVTSIALSVGGLIFTGYAVRLLRNRSMIPWVDWFELGVRTLLLGGDIGLAIASGGVSKDGGRLTLYGDDRVVVGAPNKISLRSGALADLSAGVSASVQGVVTASLASAGIAAMRGTYLAAVEGTQVRVRSRGVTTVSVLKGTVSVEGNRIRLGRRRLRSEGGKPVARKRSLMDAKMEATRHVFVEAEQQLQVTVGTPGPANGRVAVLPTAFVASAGEAAVSLAGGGAAVTSGKAAIRVHAKGIRLGCLADDVDETYRTQVEAAQKTRDLEDDKLGKKSALREGLVGSVVGSMLQNGEGGAAVAAGMLGAQAQGDGQARDESTAHRKADNAFTDGVKAALEARTTSVRDGFGAARPVIDVSEDAILLRVGNSAIKLTSAGIQILSAGGEGIQIRSTATLSLNDDATVDGVAGVNLPDLPPAVPPPPPEPPDGLIPTEAVAGDAGGAA